MPRLLPDIQPTQAWKTCRRHLRYLLLRALSSWLQTRPATALPKLRRLLRPCLPFFFAREMRRAQELLPEEFSSRKQEILDGMAFNLLTTFLEVFLYDSLLAERSNFISWSGAEHLERAVANGRTFIILSAHFGNWELIAYSLVRMGYPIHAIARPQAISKMTAFMNEFRERRGVQVLMANNLRESLRLLRDGVPIGVVSDLNARELGYQVQFFGRTASFYPTPVLLSQRGRAPLIPTFVERDRRGNHHIRFEEPVEWLPGWSMQERVQAYVQRYECAFRRRPDHWVWFHERYQHADLGRVS